MRTKRSLAFVLAMVMILALIPASAFAATTNSVTKTPTVASESPMPAVQLDITAKDVKGMDGEQKIKLTVENGKWNIDPLRHETTNEIYSITLSAIPGVMNTSYAATLINDDGYVDTVKSVSISESSAEFVFTPNVGFEKDKSISLLLNIKSGADAGEVKVKLESIDSQVSPGTYTVGIVGSGNTVATVADDPTKVGRTEIKAAPIEIREVAVNSVTSGAHSIKLTLPKGVEWYNGTGSYDPKLIGGDMLVSAATAYVQSDARDLIITFSAVGANTREMLSIIPHIKIGKDAKYGDITVQIRNQKDTTDSISEASGLVIAVYGDEEVSVTTVKEADLPQIIAGREFKSSNGTEYTVEVTLEENQKGALIRNKYVDFTFPEWVQIVSGSSVKYKIDGGAKTTLPDTQGDSREDNSSFEWLVPSESNLSTGKAHKIVFTIPVTIDAAQSGDIDLTVNGTKAGVNSSTIVVGKALAPFTVEVVKSNVRTGVQNQAVGDIIIKETTVGAISDDKTLNELLVWMDSNNQDINFSAAKAEVTAGDLELKTKPVTIYDGKTHANYGAFGIAVDRTSLKTPAEIKISGIEVTLNRTPAEGPYDVKLGGSSVVRNSQYNDKDFSSAAVTTPYLTVVTPADSGVNATFVIGQSSYTANGVSQTMDAAPYIDAAGRTMVPIRYIANAMGVPTDQVSWNQGTQTATIFGKYIVSVKMGSNVITSNGTPITMDTVAVNNAGRIYVPLRYIANALGGSVDWDQATKTATIYTVKQ